MNKIFIYFLCLNFLFLPVFAYIEDDFVKNTLDSSLIIGKKKQVYYKDDFALDTLDRTKTIKDRKKPVYEDNLVSKLGNLALPIVKSIPKEEEYIKCNVDYDALKIPVKEHNILSENESDIVLRIKEKVSTKQRLEEGEKLDFVLTNDVKIKNKLYKKGTTVTARVETVSMNKSYGVPADLIVGNFKINEVNIPGEIKKTGANRSLWVYPCGYVGIIFFGAGLLLFPIRGGHAKINPRESFTLYSR